MILNVLNVEEVWSPDLQIVKLLLLRMPISSPQAYRPLQCAKDNIESRMLTAPQTVSCACSGASISGSEGSAPTLDVPSPSRGMLHLALLAHIGRPCKSTLPAVRTRCSVWLRIVRAH